MTGAAGADLLVAGRVEGAAGVAGHGIHDAAQVLEHRLHTPETAAGEHRGVHACHDPDRRRLRRHRGRLGSADGRDPHAGEIEGQRHRREGARGEDREKVTGLDGHVRSLREVVPNERRSEWRGFPLPSG